MDDEKYDRSIALMCPTCGGTQFSFPDEDSNAMVTCMGCDCTLTRDELIHENSENIEEHVEEIKAEVFEDVQKEFRDMLKKTFGGNKNFRIK